METHTEAPQSWAPAGIRERHVWIALAVAMAAAAALDLWLGRGTGFTIDEIRVFDSSANLDLRTALLPFNGHLILTWRLTFSAILHLFGVGYLPFRLLTTATVLTTAVVFFVFAKRRIGPVAALAPTVVLLVFGSDPVHILRGNGFDVVLPVAAGVGALLALDRGDLRGDVFAFLLLCLALASYSVAIPYLAGAAVLILIGEDRGRRVWVVLVPAALYGAWFLWSQGQAGNAGNNVKLSNLLLAPDWALNSLAAVGAALLGLNYPLLGNGWGPVIALAAVVALGWRLWRGSIPRWLWVAMTVPAALWLIAAAAAMPPIRFPQKTEYMFPATVAVLLVAVEAARDVRIQRRGMIILYAAAAIGVLTNIALLRDASRQFRVANTVYRSNLGAAEIVADRVSRLSRPELPPGLSVITGPLDKASYFEAVRKFGSPALSLASLRTQSEATRDRVDGILADTLGLHLQPGPAPTGPCRVIVARPGGPVIFRVPRGGVLLKTGGAPAPVALRRFARMFTVQVGQPVPGQWTTLSVPSDSAPDPWYAATATSPVTICRLS
jgi:hypothetical protein